MMCVVCDKSLHDNYSMLGVVARYVLSVSVLCVVDVVSCFGNVLCCAMCEVSRMSVVK